MHEDQQAQGCIYVEIDEPVRARTSELRVYPRCDPDRGSYVDHQTVQNSDKCPNVLTTYC